MASRTCDGWTLPDEQADPDDTAIPARSKPRSEEHTSELQSRLHLVCRLLLEKKKPVRRAPPVVQPIAHERSGPLQSSNGEGHYTPPVRTPRTQHGAATSSKRDSPVHRLRAC